jgi:hypothetical protein
MGGYGMKRTALLAAAVAAFVVIVGGIAEIYRLETRVSELQWESVVADFIKHDTIAPEVGIIQFIKSGTFSIVLDKVEYKSDGLLLEGSIGNASNIRVDNLSLQFVATKQIIDLKADYNKTHGEARDTFSLFGYPTIGTGQSTAFTVYPGAHTAFSVTIPNVKQTKGGERIEVSFSGERYSYLQ